MTLSSAYLLVFHGSRDRRTQFAASNLGLLLTKELKSKFKSKTILTQQNYLSKNSDFSQSAMITTLDLPKVPLVEVAPLELTSISLNESLVDFAQQASQKGFKQINVLPLFLAPGIHVQEDIPREITSAIKQINNPVTVELSPYLGKYSGIVPLLAQKFDELSGQTRILIAHGSRLAKVAHYYQSLASQLNAVIACWSVAPSLEEQVKAQIASGKQKIAILPYFLFPGRITDAIAEKVEILQEKYPQVELILGQPLGTTEALAKLIAEEVEI